MFGRQEFVIAIEAGDCRPQSRGSFIL